MLPSEKLRNCNQRFIPLTAELIMDIWESEGLEYHTPPGGHANDLELCHNAEPLRRPPAKPQQSSVTCSWDESERKGDKDHQDHHHLQKCESQYQFEQLSRSSDEESSNFESIIDLLRSVGRLNNIRDAQKSGVGRGREQPEACCMEFLKSSRSDSLISTSSKPSTEARDLHADNFYAMNQLWINVMVKPKSTTSLLMNQYKLQNYKINSSNAYYTPTEKDIMRDHDAYASLLARPRKQRNSRNVPR